MRPDSSYDAGGFSVNVYSSGTILPYSAASNSERMSIMSAIGMAAGVSIFAFDSNREAEWYGGCTREGAILINPNSIAAYSGNYYDIYLTFIHEKSHRDTNYTHGSHYDEIMALKAQMDSPYFGFASLDYQNFIKSKYTETLMKWDGIST